MNINKRIKTIVMSGLLCLTANNAYSQTDSLRIMTEQSDSITALQSSLPAENTLSKDDSVLIARNMPLKKKEKRNWETWHPEAKKALWLALVIPGAGQIYNRKYWKLPIVYGGFVGCLYALRWNNQMYKDYSQAYIDIMDNDPQTKSYESFLHLGTQVTQDNLARYQTVFNQRKDKYRKWRDMSIFSLVAVYALSVIDAYVDASLSEFDISKDLSLKVSPTVINNKNERNPLKANALGVQCSFTF